MLAFLKDLFAHQEWADAEHWRAIELQPAALNDAAIRNRLHHIHLVQHAFCSAVLGEAPVFPAVTDFPGSGDLKAYGRRANARLATLVAELTAEQMAARLEVPWFKDTSLDITVGQGLAQAAMHSHYHRGQNATRLRELGGEPPLTDLIVWYLKCRPVPDWGVAQD